MKSCLYEIHLKNGRSAKWGISGFEEFTSVNNLLKRINQVIPTGAEVDEDRTRIYIFNEPKFNRALEKNIHLKFQKHRDLTISLMSGYTEWFHEIVTYDIRNFVDAWIQINDVLCEIVTLQQLKESITFDTSDIPKDDEAITDIISDEKVQHILSYTQNNGRQKERNYLILVLLFYCGLKTSELLNLKIHDVISEDKLVHHTLKLNDREIQLSHSVVRDALRDYITTLKTVDINSFLLESQKGGKFHNVAMCSLIIKLIRIAAPEVSGSANICRVTFIKKLISNGVNLKTVQKIAGHKHISNTMRYVNKEETINELAVMKQLYD